MQAHLSTPVLTIVKAYERHVDISWEPVNDSYV